MITKELCLTEAVKNAEEMTLRLIEGHTFTDTELKDLLSMYRAVLAAVDDPETSQPCA